MSKTKKSLDRLKGQRDKLNARIQTEEARAKVSERKKDVRRKILVGSYYLDKANKENQFEELKLVMAGYLKRNTDRVLFDLEALPEQKKDS